MKIERFEDLDAWKEARKLRKMISTMTRGEKAQRDREFCGQIRRAALSVMLNIAEGFEADTTKESIALDGWARRSCGEVRSALYAALDDGYATEADFRACKLQAEKTGAIITGLIRYLRTVRSGYCQRLGQKA